MPLMNELLASDRLTTSESPSVKARILAQVEREYIIRALEETYWEIEGTRSCTDPWAKSEHASHSNGAT